jgi:ubiquinone/menaquinone biosynthesis C-methylase UbiE
MLLREAAKEDKQMAFEELKSRQGVMWGSGPFEKIADTISDLHETVTSRLEPRTDVNWLDLGCGTGAVAERAAAQGAEVTGIDLSPVLIETAKQRADERGLDIDYRVGDVEHLEVGDHGYDVVSSVVGTMFAPNHEAVASELARVTKPAGRLGLANWTMEGGVGKMFGMMKPFQPPPPEGVGNQFDWGREEYVHELLGDAFELEFERHVSRYQVPSAEEYWAFYSANYGPTKTLADSLDDERREEFHRAWVDFFESNYGSDGQIDHDREWLFVYGTRR